MVDNISGIEILNIVTRHKEGAPALVALAIIFGVLAAGVAIYLYYAAINNILDKCGGRSLITIISCFVLALIFSGLAILMFAQVSPLWSEKENIAYVTIDDTVPWSVVNEQYELVEQEGKIYLLRIKEQPQENCNE